MNFREMYFRDDIETIKNSPAPSADMLRSDRHRTLTQKNVDKIHREAISKQVNDIESLNRRLYKEIEKAKKMIKDSGKNPEVLDNLISHVTICNEEILTANDAKQVAAILKLNNSGMFDDVFKQIAQDAQQETEPATETNSDPQQ